MAPKKAGTKPAAKPKPASQPKAPASGCLIHVDSTALSRSCDQLGHQVTSHSSKDEFDDDFNVENEMAELMDAMAKKSTTDMYFDFLLIK